MMYKCDYHSTGSAMINMTDTACCGTKPTLRREDDGGCGVLGGMEVLLPSMFPTMYPRRETDDEPDALFVFFSFPFVFRTRADPREREIENSHEKSACQTTGISKTAGREEKMKRQESDGDSLKPR
jgi:hypothetical protein